jgi:predicted transcriptional regulator YdeE/ubiquinone/menaquinone biosynthesis C-methylase UbiE
MVQLKSFNTHKLQSVKSTVKNCNLRPKASYKNGSSQTKAVIDFGINGGAALEIGPGPGCFGLEWLKATDNSTLTGLEITAEMVKLAEINATEYGFLNERARYLAYITKTLPFEDNSFEAVFSNSSLHEWSEPAVMFNEIYRVLKPGGRYYVSDLRRDMNPLVKYYLKHFHPEEVSGNLPGIRNTTFTEKEINDILSKTKLSGSKISKTPFRLIITGIKPKITRLNAPIQAIGISINTCFNKASIEIDQLCRRYLKDNISNIIPNKKSPGVFITATKNYHPTEKTFTYFLGDEVTSISEIPEGLIDFEVPSLSYVVFTVRPNGSNDWTRAITDMKNYIYEYWFPNSHYEKAKVINEFELYDERSKSPKNPEMDIFVAIQ